MESEIFSYLLAILQNSNVVLLLFAIRFILFILFLSEANSISNTLSIESPSNKEMALGCVLNGSCYFVLWMLMHYDPTSILILNIFNIALILGSLDKTYTLYSIQSEYTTNRL